MPSLKDVIDAFNATWPVALAALVASLSLLACDIYDVKYLQRMPPWTVSAAFIVAIASSSVIIARSAQALVERQKKKASDRLSAARRSEHARKVWELPEEEQYLLCWAVANKQQVFMASFIEPRLQPLVAKGYIYRLNGRYSVLEWPYRIADHVWDEMIRDWTIEPYKIDQPNPFQRSLSGW